MNAEKNIKVAMRLKDGYRYYELDRRYFYNKKDISTEVGTLVLDVKYPEMSPCDRDVRPKQKCVLIVLGVETKLTHGEFIVDQWRQDEDKKDKGPGFDRYVGDEGPYQIFKSQLGKNPNTIVRNQVFTDDFGNFVADDGRKASARVSGMVVVYDGAKNYQAAPKEMHAWISGFVKLLENNQLTIKQ